MIQPWFPRWCATRWGFAYHSCVLWAARGKIGPGEVQQKWNTEVDKSVDVVIVYREFVASDLSEPQLAERIVELTPKDERKIISRHFMTPPECFGLKGSRNTIADQMGPILREAKIPEPEPADEDVIGGWRLVYNSLRRARLLAESKELTEAQIKEGPCLFISGECDKLRNALPVFTRDRTDSEIVGIEKRPADSYDDTSDACGEALRILCKSMLSAKVEAPYAVRRREVWDSQIDPTERGLAMLRFDSKEREKRVLVRRKPWR
jgi:hypothetical protein